MGAFPGKMPQYSCPGETHPQKSCSNRMSLRRTSSSLLRAAWRQFKRLELPRGSTALVAERGAATMRGFLGKAGSGLHPSSDATGTGELRMEEMLFEKR